MAEPLARIHVSGAALGPLPFAASMDWTGSYARGFDWNLAALPRVRRRSSRR
jgi:hypothetical protein